MTAANAETGRGFFFSRCFLLSSRRAVRSPPSRPTEPENRQLVLLFLARQPYKQGRPRWGRTAMLRKKQKKWRRRTPGRHKTIARWSSRHRHDPQWARRDGTYQQTRPTPALPIKNLNRPQIKNPPFSPNGTRQGREGRKGTWCKDNRGPRQTARWRGHDGRLKDFAKWGGPT